MCGQVRDAAGGQALAEGLHARALGHERRQQVRAVQYHGDQRRRFGCGARTAGPEKFAVDMAVDLRDDTETPQFTDHVIRAIYNDPDILPISGTAAISAEMAARFSTQSACQE